MKRFKGFTLTELMIALSVIGILVAIVTPAIMKTRPNKNKMMVKKTFYTTEQIVGTLINDERLYPDMTDGCDATPVADSCAWGFDYDKSVKYEGVTYSGSSKFYKLFKSKLNLSKDNGYEFYTTDGVKWDLRGTGAWVKKASTVDGAGEGIIVIDVNGDDPPNKRENASSSEDFDQYQILVKANGKLRIDPADAKAIEYVTINTSIRDAL